MVKEALVQERDRLFKLLNEVPFLNPYPSYSNFILCEVTSGMDAKKLKVHNLPLLYSLNYFVSCVILCMIDLYPFLSNIFQGNCWSVMVACLRLGFSFKTIKCTSYIIEHVWHCMLSLNINLPLTTLLLTLAKATLVTYSYICIAIPISMSCI